MEVLSEDWNEDFVFEARPDDDDGFDFGEGFDDGNRRGDHYRGAVGLPERGRYVIVPQAIKERQANVHGDLGQVKDFALLVEELKRLRIVAQARGIVEGPSAELWGEADDIIDLASSNHDQHDHDQTNGGYGAHSSTSALPPHSPSSPGWGWGFDPFEDEPSPAALAAGGPSRKRRKSVLSLDEEFYSSPATTGTSNGTQQQQQPQPQSRDRPPDEDSGGGSGISSNGSNGSSSNGNMTNSPAWTNDSGSNGSSNGLYGSNGSSTTTTTTTTHHRSSPSLSRMPSRSSRHESSPSVARTVIETIHQRRTAVGALPENISPFTPAAPPPPPPKKMQFDSTTLRELVAHVRLLSRRLAELVRGAERESPMMTATTATTTMMPTIESRSQSQSPHLSPTPSFGQVLAGSVTSSPSFGSGRPAKKSRSATDVLAPPSTMTAATGKENEMEMSGGGPILMAVI